MPGRADGKSTFVFDGDSKEFHAVVKQVLKDLEKARRGGERTAKTFAQLKKEFADTKALQHLGDEVGDLNDELLDTAPAAKSAGASIKGLASEAAPAALALTAAAAAGFQLVASASAITDEIKLAAGQTGTMVETMTAMRFAAQDGGSSADSMTESITALAGKIKEARKNTGEGETAFDKYGIRLDNLNGTARSTDAILRDVLDTLAAQGTQSAKTEAALSLMNESAGKVPAIFDKGSESLDEWTKKTEVQAIAAAVTEGKLDEYNATMAELSLAADAATVALGEGFLPAVVSTVKAITDVVGPAASLLGTLWETKEALDTINPLYWLAVGVVKAFTVATDLAHAATVQLGLALSDEEKALAADIAAWKEFDEQLVAGFETQEQADKKAKERAEARAEAAKKAAEEEAKLNEKRMAAAARAAAEAARILAMEEKGRADFAKAQAAGVQARIDDMKALAAVEETALSDRLEALAAVRDSVQEELAVRSAAVDEIKRLNDEKAADDLETIKATRELLKEVDKEIKADAEEAAQLQLDMDAEHLEERKSLMASWRDSAIEAASAVTSMILDSIQQQKQAEDDLQAARLDDRIANLKSQETLTTRQAENLERLETKRKNLMLAEFKRNKEATLVAIGLATLQAMAVAATAAVPPANVPFIAAAAAIGAGQLGLAAATKPPALHDGGKVQAGVGAAPDELDRRLKAGEFVMNSGATAGNEDTLKEMNRTNGSAPAGRSRRANPDDVRAALVDWLLGEIDGDGEIGARFGRALQGTAGAFR